MNTGKNIGKQAEANEGLPPTYDEAVDGSPPPATPEEKPRIHEATGSKKPQSHSPTTPLSTPPLVPSGPLTFKVVHRKPFLDRPKIFITPDQPFGNLSSWCMHFYQQGNATVSRHAPYPQDKLPIRDIAHVKYPEPVHHPYGILVKFKPSEAEIEKKGLRHVSDTERMLVADGYLTSWYGIDMPVGIGFGERVEWRVVAVEKGEESVKSEKSEWRDEKAPAMPPAGSSKQAWTPFSTQSLVEELSGKVLATFSHSAPFARETGILTIPQSSGNVSAEFVEAIIITVAAMVGFQDRVGLTSLFLESGYEYLSLKGKNKV